VRVLLRSLVFALLLASARSALAAGPEIAVSVDPCVPVNHAQLERILAIELGTSTAGQNTPHPPTHVWVSCGVQGIELRLEDPLTRKSMFRVLPASSFRDASSTRLLALAIAEFVVASWIELRVQPTPAVEPLGPRPSPAQTARATQVLERRAPNINARTSSLSIGAQLSLWSANDSVMFGASLRFVQQALAPLAWTLGADVNHGSVGSAVGDVSVTTGSVSLALALHVKADDVVFYSGPGGRIGFARLSGDPRDPTRTVGTHFFAPYGGLCWWNRIEYRGESDVLLALEFELGLVTLPATATSYTGSGLALRGVWFTPGLSLGLAF
jgi:hypothetical protein